MRRLLVSRSPPDTTHGHIMAAYGNEECPRRWLTSHQKHVESVCRAIASGCGSDLEAAPESSGARQCDSAAGAAVGRTEFWRHFGDGEGLRRKGQWLEQLNWRRGR